MANDPWSDFPAVSTPSGGPVYGPAPDRSKQEAEERARAAEARAAAAAQRDAAKDSLIIQDKQQDLEAGPGGKATESERKAAAFLIRALGANEAFEGTDVADQPRGLIAQKLQDVAPNVSNKFINSSGRQVADSAQDEFIAASLRQDSGAAIPPEELERQRRIYFPMPGDGPDVIEQKREARIRAIEGLKQSAGRLEESAQARYDAMVGLTGTVTDDSPPETPENPNDITVNKNAVAAQLADQFNGPDGGGYSTLAKQGITLGLSDEASGIGGGIAYLLQGKSPVQGYIDNRDAERIAIERARAATGWTGTAMEFMGAGGAAKLGVGANAMLQGMTLGGVGGFGYGEGTQGSLAGTAGGAALGYGFARGGQFVGDRLANRAVQSASQRMQMADRARRLQEAGQAEGVTVNRAMVDPHLQNRVTGADATIVGGPKIQGEMRKVEGQIEEGVGRLGAGGKDLTPVGGGATLDNAGVRFIRESGERARVRYDAAAQASGGSKVMPIEASQRVTAMTQKLSETPNTNKAEISALQELQEDLSKPLSVQGFRDLRTKWRQKIKKSGDLTFGADEAGVMDLLDAAGDDIYNGLLVQGKRGAAEAFRTADKAYRARMEYIDGVVQKVIGKRNSNLSAEDVFKKMEAMARGKDAATFRKFFAALTPEERGDITATLVTRLGTNNKGNFSPAFFLSQTSNMDDSVIRTMFGKEGAQSIINLRLLSEEATRVTGAMNSRKSGTGVANDWRGWMMNLLFGGGAAAVSGNLGAGTGLAVAGMGTKALIDGLSARALMSPNLSRWLKNVPATSNPAAINAYYAKLGEVVKLEPALANDVEFIRRTIMQAANDQSGSIRAAAGDEPKDQGEQ